MQLVWFRHDLRIADNPALLAAYKKPPALVEAIYFFRDDLNGLYGFSPSKRWFLEETLKDLQANLAKLGVRLSVIQVNAPESIKKWFKKALEQNPDLQVYAQVSHVPVERDEERVLSKLLDKQIHWFDSDTLLPLGSIASNPSKSMYQRYTPFAEQVTERLFQSGLRLAGSIRHLRAPITDVPKIEITGDKKAVEGYQVGEQMAHQCLEAFLSKRCDRYAEERDFPGVPATTRFSAYFTLGVLSVKQAVSALYRHYPRFLSHRMSGPFSWYREIIWREFYRHLMYAYPRLGQGQPFLSWTNNLSWENNPELIDRWKNGKTGFPIIDAGMRQLVQSGWMHNRLRMLTATTLVKLFNVDWRIGERFFLEHLIDGDLASNNGGWQWSASTGTDAQPFFRIFNLETQMKRYDAKGTFIKAWVPELGHSPAGPSMNDSLESVDCGIYPKPCIDYRIARQAALDRYRTAQQKHV